MLLTPQLSALSEGTGPPDEGLREEGRERRYTELVGPRSRLLVAGVEVGGRWSDETGILVSQLAKTTARQKTWLLRQRPLTLGKPRAVGADRNTPATYDVECDFRHAGLAS